MPLRYFFLARTAWTWLVGAALLACAVESLPARAEEDAIFPAFLAVYCLECHRGEKPKGELRLDQLTSDFADDAAREKWLLVAKRIAASEMPPKEKPRPPEKEVRKLVDWIRASDEAAEAERRTKQGRAVLRRLNRAEYENTIRDLLGIEIELRDLLPADTSADGFDNVGSALHTSSFLIDKYLEAADKALNLAISNGPQPPVFSKRLLFKDERYVKITTEKVFRVQEDGLVMFSSSQWNAITMGQFYPPDRGRYRFRISARAVQSGDKPVSYRIDAGPMLMGTKNHLVGYFDALPEKASVTEFVGFFEARSTIRLLPHGLANAQTVDKIGADKYEGPGLVVEWVEVEGPLHDSWPAESHRRIFGDLPRELSEPRDWRKRVEVVSKDPPADAKRILAGFARRAFRRSVTDADIQPFLALFESKQAAGQTFEQAIRVALKSILISPEFLFLREKPGRLDDFALASRLSYFFWSSMPDEPLLALAEQGKLGDPAVLREQVERMLASPKAAAMTENFLGQWLSLRDLDFTEPDRGIYPEYDDMLRAAMGEEPKHFWNELVKGDLSLTNLVASDFTFLNERLARHYGVPGVTGHALTKVALPPESHRGGVMTMAAVLKVTANGTTTSPVLRGAWVLDRILGTPPTPPPAGVAAVEPDIRGATTIREQLAKHREVESCAVCHRQIDPAGFALESYDVIGGWREYYRSIGRGKEVTIDGRRMRYYQGPDVDPADKLADGRPFANIDELKQLLLADKDHLARALATKLVTYGSGQSPRTSDRAQLDAIAEKVKPKDYGLRTLMHEIVQSELFRNK